MRRTILAAAIVCSCLLAARPAVAAWPHPSDQNLRVGSPSGFVQIQPMAVPDGAGGFIVAWSEYFGPTEYDIVAQRIDRAGNAVWNPAGVVLCSATSQQYPVAIVEDGADGAVVVFWDYRNPTAPDLYATRVASDGSTPWGTAGMPVCLAAGSQHEVSLVRTRGFAGEVLIAWADERAGLSADDIYVQRLQSNGSPGYAVDGVAVCNAANTQFSPVLGMESLNHFFVAWGDYRGGGSSDLYVQRAQVANAAVSFQANGLELCTAAGEQGGLQMVSNGDGTVVVGWSDGRSGIPDIYAQLVHGGGPGWAANGVPVCTAAGTQHFLRMAAVPPSLVAFVWQDNRSGDTDLYAQILDGYGDPRWTVDGVEAVVAAHSQASPSIAVDGEKNLLIACQDYRATGSSSDLYAQRLDPLGVRQFALGGVPVATASGSQTHQSKSVVADGTGGLFVAWADERAITTHVYAQRVDRWGILGGEPAIASVTDVPNDEGGRVKVSWDASPLDLDPQFWNVTEYFVFRSVPSAVAAELLARGEARLVDLDETPKQDLAATGSSTTRRLMTTVSGATTWYWEQVGTTTAQHLSGYSLIAPTSGDSTGDNNAPTAFMVRARSFGGGMWWDSEPDSGYSVDDLAPAAPAPFTGQYFGAVTELVWGANSESDLLEYRLHRGVTADFVPGPENLISAQSGTGYDDEAGAPYFYKLAAVDVHGNLSPYSLVLPEGTVDVSAGVAHVFYLAAPAPNPVSDGAELRFVLSRTGPARLALYDVSGRCMGVLVDRTLEAGPHRLRWDGRDAAGARVAPGLYLLRLEAGGRTAVRRLAVTR